jgi:hypothetical protein
MTSEQVRGLRALYNITKDPKLLWHAVQELEKIHPDPKAKKELQTILAKYKDAEVSFSRKEKFIIANGEYTLTTLTPDVIDYYLEGM